MLLCINHEIYCNFGTSTRLAVYVAITFGIYLSSQAKNKKYNRFLGNKFIWHIMKYLIKLVREKHTFENN